MAGPLVARICGSSIPALLETEERRYRSMRFTSLATARAQFACFLVELKDIPAQDLGGLQAHCLLRPTPLHDINNKPESARYLFRQTGSAVPAQLSNMEAGNVHEG